MDDVKLRIERSIGEVLAEMARGRGVSEDALPPVYLERPKRTDQGDWATNVAMQGAKLFCEKPRAIAERIALRFVPGEGGVSRVEVAGPGFINFFLDRSWMQGVLSRILDEGENYGRCDLGKGRRVQVEFVSANPTGPLHVGHGRGAAVGDVMASILDFAGWGVEREYYINDAGLQMELLGKSMQARYFELLGEAEKVPLPEDGYQGEYLIDIARGIVEAEGRRFLEIPPAESLSFFRDYACVHILERIRRDLDEFGVRFDVWFSERSLYENDSVPRMLERLKERGFAYDKDGAVWFRATAFGDEKDRVLVRSNEAPTYFASDIAYHKNKFDRGFDLLIDVWGADHHGYIPRVKAAVEALGRDREDFQVLLIQLVNLLANGQPVAMSKRSGQFVTLRDVLEDVGVDATRYFFLMRRCDSHLDFDLELAKSASADNPVYYVQYAHARIASILREAASRGVEPPDRETLDVSLFNAEEEESLVKRLSLFPEEIVKAAREFAPHRLVFYVYDLACAFHAFYNAHRVLDEAPPLRDARLLLIRAVRVVLATVLRLLGVSAPEKM